MKLSEKALKKIEDEMERGEYQIPCGYENVEGMSIYHLEEYEFEPDDFRDAVILTVEEAKEFKSYFDFVCNGMSISDSLWGEVHYLRNKIWGALNRSERAEGKK